MRFMVLRIVAGTGATCLAFGAVGCKKTVSSLPPPPPQVVVTAVIQKDVPVYSEWVGTTEGFVNAEIYPKISGYLLKQNYQDGDLVHTGQLLFEIDDRQYRTAYDEAAANYLQESADLKENQQDLARYIQLLQEQVISRQQFDHINQTTKASAAATQSAAAAMEAA